MSKTIVNAEEDLQIFNMPGNPDQKGYPGEKAWWHEQDHNEEWMADEQAKNEVNEDDIERPERTL